MSEARSDDNEQHHHTGCDVRVMEMEAAGSLEMLVAIYQTVQSHMANSVLLTPVVQLITYP